MALLEGPLTQPPSWPPVLKHVGASSVAAKAVLGYILGSKNKRGSSVEINKLLVGNLSILTPTTIWLLMQDDFWQLPTQMVNRLTVSFTVYDRFDGSMG